jgi:hypothetical protein
MTSYMNSMIEGFLPTEASRFLARFLKLHSDRLNEETLSVLRYSEPGKKTQKFLHHRNLFLPQNLGGMGVTRPKGFKSKTTQNDLRVAQCQLDELGSLSTQLPLPGPACAGELDARFPHENARVDEVTTPIYRCRGPLSIRNVKRFGKAIPYATNCLPVDPTYDDPPFRSREDAIVLEEDGHEAILELIRATL